ncbi:MAG: T9SS type A sorting domain-containing protein [Bacteroidetes bacterium]|nr:T9SS type A sorting domain-containing protein [Bacteroidota bacterium]
MQPPTSSVNIWKQRGQSLSWYFDDWFTGEGYPSYQVDWSHSGTNVDLVINQTQSHSSVSYFELPVPIQFTDGIHDTIVRLDNTFSGQTYSFSLPFTPTSAYLDPNSELITAGNFLTGVSQYDLENDIALFPNPSTNFVSVRLLKQLSPYAKLSVVDITGRTLKEQTVTGTFLSVDLTKLTAGTYFISIYDSQTKLYKKLIKQ